MNKLDARNWVYKCQIASERKCAKYGCMPLHQGWTKFKKFRYPYTFPIPLSHITFHLNGEIHLSILLFSEYWYKLMYLAILIVSMILMYHLQYFTLKRSMYANLYVKLIFFKTTLFQTAFVSLTFIVNWRLHETDLLLMCWTMPKIYKLVDYTKGNFKTSLYSYMKIDVIFNCPEGVVDISKKGLHSLEKTRLIYFFINWKKVKTDILVHSTMQIPIKGAILMYTLIQFIIASRRWLIFPTSGLKIL